MNDLPNVIMVVITGLLLRWSVAYHDYSGAGRPPMYGDYEAQRHWMEVTLNLPIDEWYFPTEKNDLQYWGLDYPPLTAYHSWLNGKIASYINVDWVALNSSRGFESNEHKLFMRLSVFASDLLIFIPAVLAYAFLTKSHVFSTTNLKTARFTTPIWTYITALDFLLYPGFILIDHGHFQYNCVSLGLALFAITAALKHHRVISSILFVMALSYKQMLLYYALPFFSYFLGQCFFLYKRSKVEGVKAFLKIALTVVVTFGVIWYPFITDVRQLKQVLHRIFPVGRGLFEDKVANVWCFLSVIYKFKLHISSEVMAMICSILTLLFSLPSCILLFFHPSQKAFVLSLINVSMAFFLFSFQVHEKTILVVAIPILIYFSYSDFHCLWFSFISTFSMFPLLLKDGLFLPYSALIMFFIVIERNFVDATWTGPLLAPVCSYVKRVRWISLLNMSFFGCIVLTFLHALCPPPSTLPDLFPLLIALYSTAHFFYFFIYFYVAQLFARDPYEWDFGVRPKYD